MSRPLHEQLAGVAAAGRKAEALLATKAEPPAPQTQQTLKDAIHASVLARLKQAADDAARRRR